MTINTENQQPLDLASLRNRLAIKKGEDYWRSLNELAETEEFAELIQQEFPRQAGLLNDMSRREFLKVIGSTVLLAGLAACVPQPSEKILPYVNPPEELVPAKPIYFASAMSQDGYAKGVLVETTFGRPIKVEGNPLHPDSLGATDVFMQASLLELYDPDRARQVTDQGAPKTWQDFVSSMNTIFSGLGEGAGLRVLSGPSTSPTLINQLNSLLNKYPQAKWVQFSPLGRGNSHAASQLAFGQIYDPIYHFDIAEVVLSLDCDFLFSEPGHLRYSHDFMARHQPISTNGTMSRLYMLEGSATLTGSVADHRLAIKPSQVEAFAQALASRLGVAGVTAPAGSVPGQDWLDAVTADLKKAGKAALVVAGERQPAVVHALAYAMNQVLGGVGATVTFIPAIEANPSDPNAALKELAQELNNGVVETLVILDGNPAYTSPADINFAEAMKKAKTSVYLGLYADETAAQATWFVPAAHYLETWGDGRAFDGSASIIQPMIEPLYGGKSAIELIAALLGSGDAKGYDLVRATWQGQAQVVNFDLAWREWLSKGLIPNTAAAPVASLTPVNAAVLSGTGAASNGLEIVFEPDQTVWDGRFTNNAWLQELPKPLTKLTWDNAAFINPATATKLGVDTNDVVSMQLRGRSLEAAVFIQPGQPDDVIVITLGYGRKAGGNVLAGTGFNAYAIRSSDALWFDSGVEVTKTGKTYALAATHEHWTMENRDLIREATLQEYQQNPNFAQLHEAQPPTLFGNEDTYPGYSWGMSINLSSCIGCNACVIACQAENNIPIVGKDQVARGREMHWLRIDRYYKGSLDRPSVSYQPVPCMHCEHAPCEPVCPVEATSHSAEGLNEMTYNRCVGTRYCSNNCPYKVRRFNFYKYVDENVIPLKAMRNPDVTVRMRGVMEKCTYCVQRINNARIQAEVEGRQIQEGEVRTACQQACPTNAIVFGDINNANSAVQKMKATPLNYGLLDELGTLPRTTYLGKVTNPNPNIQEQA